MNGNGAREEVMDLREDRGNADTSSSRLDNVRADSRRKDELTLIWGRRSKVRFTLHEKNKTSVLEYLVWHVYDISKHRCLFGGWWEENEIPKKGLYGDTSFEIFIKYMS